MEIKISDLTDLQELPAVIKHGEVIIPPRPEFLSEEGLVKLKALATNLGGEVIYYKVRARFENLEIVACVKQGCFNKVEGLLYCSTHEHSTSRIGQTNSATVTNLRPAR